MTGDALADTRRASLKNGWIFCYLGVLFYIYWDFRNLGNPLFNLTQLIPVNSTWLNFYMTCTLPMQYTIWHLLLSCSYWPHHCCLFELDWMCGVKSGYLCVPVLCDVGACGVVVMVARTWSWLQHGPGYVRDLWGSCVCFVTERCWNVPPACTLLLFFLTISQPVAKVRITTK